MEINEKSQFYVPDYYHIEEGSLHLFLDHEMPNWIITDRRGGQIIEDIKSCRNMKELIHNYAVNFNVDYTKAWLEVHTFLKDLIRSEFLTSEPVKRTEYTGRADFIHAEKLNELWLHTNNSCNLTCSHCLVNSSPNEDKGLSTEVIKRIIDEATTLGTTRFYFTGGEPFIRKDIFELTDYICNHKKSELIILTNGTLLKGETIEELQKFDKKYLKIQISLDGSRPEVNDPLRGKGSFNQIVEGIKNSIRAGYYPTVTTVIANSNIDDIPEATKLLASLGVKTHHLLWAHKRGRITDNGNNSIPPIDKVIEVTRRVKEVAGESGITVDNHDSYKFRSNSNRGTRYDLGNACYDSMCVYSNGDVYPSASFAGHAGLRCGSILDNTLSEIWKNSNMSKAFRNATLQHKEKCRECHIKFVCGGGDIEHSFFFSENGFKLETDRFPADLGIHALDPYCDLHKEITKDVIFELAEVRKKMMERKTGFNAPVVLRSMGEGATVCGADEQTPNPQVLNPESVIVNQPSVHTLHSNCVLSFDVDKPRSIVREFYGKAAEEPQEELCCPTKNSDEDTSHIPQEVLDRFYGCGSPTIIAGVLPGETMVDLGAGAGIDCFIAAKKVGPKGKVYGIDMTDEMLKVANENRLLVAKNLGFDIVEFRKGFLEEIPVDSGTVDLITSNCVVNLSPDKKAVFSEMWRVLKDHGRIVISDIVSQVETPPHLKLNKQLWGECISGALTEDEFMAYLEQAGFYGLQTLSKVFWKDIEGYSFHSVTLRGYKFEKKEDCVYIGQRAVYHGPYKAITDEEGHLFPRNEPVAVCTDTAQKLSNPPYTGQFAIFNGNDGNKAAYSCSPSKEEGVSCC
ncbi:Radical-SAM methyltransferase [Candidatus Scalindua japonica]|uniref:Radical-SAM methyltransferase n=1 Tax=Candidatus Scalindua japonica TaxID=1284222 RepID=A0A286U0U1_9BACT|nr:methyltransferase domain-containing protein [Candidatus Scalindua japonica]GAX61754.1 Radical-SAM methyltransferase [Candidatus Scalindua japonica]